MVRLREDESQFIIINILRLDRLQGLVDGRDERLGVGDAFLREGFGRRVIFTCVDIKISRRVHAIDASEGSQGPPWSISTQTLTLRLLLLLLFLRLRMHSDQQFGVALVLCR